LCWFLLEDQARTETRAALALSEERLKLALDGSRIGLWDWNTKTGTVKINDRWGEIVGMSLDELEPVTPDSWLSMLHPEDVDATQKALDDHLSGRTEFYRAEFRMRHRDGRWVWVVSRGSIVQRDAAGKPVRLAGSHIEITDRRAAQEALRQSHEQLEQMVLDVAEAMGRAVEARDPYTQGHEQRVAGLARAIATHMDIDAHEIEGIEMAGLLHDIGKLRVPAEILTKTRQLTDAEFALVKEHPTLGHEILKDIAFPWPIADIVLQHHERLDGSGYPSGLKDTEILLAARILAVADVVEAMASHRPYRPALGLEAAATELRSNPEKYDGRVVAACLELCETGAVEL
jgi:PAS domain S-box-containing protein/putative nucleotidyltransferase with HDIG domain